MKRVVLLIGLSLTPGWGAQDQNFSPSIDLGADINEGVRYLGQTYTAGLTGTLAGVSVDITAFKNYPLDVQIQTAPAGVPSGTVLGETTVPSGNSSLPEVIPFPQTIPQTAGAQYAIVVSYPAAPPPGAGQGVGIWSGAGGDLYPGGQLISSIDGTDWSTASDADLSFRTFVNVSVPPGPSHWTGLGGAPKTNPAVALDSAGRLEVFAVMSDGALWNSMETSEGIWSPWSRIGGDSLNRDPAVAANADGRLEVIAVSPGNLWDFFQNSSGAWTVRQSAVDGAGAGAPAIARQSDGRLLFVLQVGSNGFLEEAQSFPGDSLHGFTAYNVPVIYNVPAKPALARDYDAAAAVALFSLSGDHALYYSVQQSEWVPFGGYITNDPAVAGPAGFLHVFGRGGDSGLWYLSELGAAGGYSGWANLGTQVVGSPTAILNTDGRIDVFTICTDHALYHIAQTAIGTDSFGEWEGLGGYLISDRVTPVLDAEGRVHVFGTGSDGGIWEISQTTAGHWQ